MRHKQEKRRIDRHVRLYHWLMRSEAWKNLPAISRALYAELARHYYGSNNGKIGYSVRQAAEDLQVCTDTGWGRIDRIGWRIAPPRQAYPGSVQGLISVLPPSCCTSRTR